MGQEGEECQRTEIIVGVPEIPAWNSEAGGLVFKAETPESASTALRHFHDLHDC